MDLTQTLRNILDAESRAVAAIPVTENYRKAIDLIYNHVCEKGGKVVASGMGKAGQIATNIASTFASTGIPAVSINPAEAQHGDLGVLQPNDVLLLVSNSGKTDEILRLLHMARMLYADIPAIAITGDVDSPLANEQGLIDLPTGNAPEVCPLGLTPTTSITTMTVIGHILVVGMMERTGFTSEQYAMRHQGGSLGEKLRKQLGK
jgi:arabinose-5-phosphate isomerase